MRNWNHKRLAARRLFIGILQGRFVILFHQPINLSDLQTLLGQSSLGSPHRGFCRKCLHLRRAASAHAKMFGWHMACKGQYKANMNCIDRLPREQGLQYLFSSDIPRQKESDTIARRKSQINERAN